jgi:hypothetical protein
VRLIRANANARTILVVVINAGDAHMSSQAKEWAELCREHQAAKEAHDEAFSGIVSGFTARLEGDAPAGPGLEDLEYEEKARRQLEEIRARMRTFVGANTWPV